MLKTTVQNPGGKRRPVATKHPVALTALLYLREALRKEAYESCSEIIAVAKEFGATDAQVGYLLEDPRRRPG